MTFVVELDSDSKKKLSVYLFEDVKNAGEIKEMVVKGSLDCCVIKPSLITHPFQIAVAANKAVINQMYDKMTTRTVYTEILYNLSISKNITQSLIKFGIGDAEKNMLVAIIEQDGENRSEDILSHFHGNICPLEELDKFSDEVLIKKTYKIKDNELTVSSLLDSIVTRIVARDFTTV
ncbi:EKC/KEOPS complex subunit Tprkb-like [Periplaneta americana]|uniref:EKC/KEOPS complex subunit Tprkb-like n=1 Tax=Periplaneta americana TaxID=6978 RepID=UPI0037E7FC1E